MHLGSNISASLLYGLSWILLCVAALMVLLALGAFFGLLTLPISVRTDLIGAAVCFGLGLLCRFMARRFEQVAYLS
jgi:hypothetical protein